MPHPPLLGRAPGGRHDRPRRPRRRRAGRPAADRRSRRCAPARPLRVPGRRRSSTAKARAAPARTRSRGNGQRRGLTRDRAQAGGESGVEPHAGRTRARRATVAAGAAHRPGDGARRPRPGPGRSARSSDAPSRGDLRRSARGCLHTGGRPPHHSGSARGERNGTRVHPQGDAGETGDLRPSSAMAAPTRPDRPRRTAAAARLAAATDGAGGGSTTGGPRTRLLGDDRRADRPPQPVLLGLLRAHRLLDLEPVVGARAVPGPSRVRHRPGRQVPADHAADARSAPCVRLPYTFAVAEVRRPQLDHRQRRCCCWSRPSLIAIVLEPGVSYTTLLVVACARRRRRRQLRLLDGQHQRLLPATGSRAGRSASTPAAATSASRSCSSSACWCWPRPASRTRG